MLVIMRDDFVERLEPAVVVKPTLLMAPESTEGRGPVLFGRRSGRLEIINADLFRSMKTRPRLGIERRYVAAGAIGFSRKERLAMFGLGFVVAAFRSLGSRNRQLIKLKRS